jgi:CrcB protein
MRTPWDVLAAVAAGGALGAAARYGVDSAWPVPAGGFPWSTLAVNLAGCAALGVVLELLAGLSAPHRLARPFLGTGLLGGFTTFSAYALETRTLLASGRPGLAAGYLAGTLFGALAALWLGMLGVRLATRRRG